MPSNQTFGGEQPALFDAPFFMPEEAMPGGFLYQENFLSAEEEAALLEMFKVLPFRNAIHNDFESHRRVVGFGWDSHPDMPGFLLPIRERAERFAGLKPGQLDSALISEYSPGTAIGWHRDKPTIGHVIGVSLAGACQFRLRRQRGTTWDRFSVPAQPRSIYCMRGESRTDWQHSIPPVEALRYSITFRDF
jgi:alkylated DNA repair dioxygenase AlkB